MDYLKGTVRRLSLVNQTTDYRHCNAEFTGFYYICKLRYFTTLHFGCVTFMIFHLLISSRVHNLVTNLKRASYTPNIDTTLQNIKDHFTPYVDTTLQNIKDHFTPYIDTTLQHI